MGLIKTACLLSDLVVGTLNSPNGRIEQTVKPDLLPDRRPSISSGLLSDRVWWYADSGVLFAWPGQASQAAAKVLP